MTGRWLVRRGNRPPAGSRLYCFPHAGGSTGEYVRWADDLPGVEVYGIQLPGRAGRIDEAPCTGMPELVDALAAAVDFEPPFVLFGHSFGALVAFETARALRRAGRPQPRLLVVSAQCPPDLPLPELPAADTTDEALIEDISAGLGPLAAAAREYRELARLVLAGYRADLALLRNYQYVPEAPLSCPIVAVGGTEDSRPAAGLGLWRRHTTSAFALHMLPGDHFYLRDQRPALLRVVAAEPAGRPPAVPAT